VSSVIEAALRAAEERDRAKVQAADAAARERERLADEFIQRHARMFNIDYVEVEPEVVRGGESTYHFQGEYGLTEEPWVALRFAARVYAGAATVTITAHFGVDDDKGVAVSSLDGLGDLLRKHLR
jgi:hypothetical protein